MEKFRSKDTAAGLAVPHYQLIRIHGRGGPPTCATSFAKATEVRKASAVAEAMADKSAGTPDRPFCLARPAVRLSCRFRFRLSDRNACHVILPNPSEVQLTPCPHPRFLQR
jgi:hypothetical protein